MLVNAWNSFRTHMKLPRLLFWVLLPFAFLIIYGGLVEVTSRDRFDSRYFTAEYTEAYNTPGAVLTAMEQALITRDETTLVALQGRTNPVVFNYTANLEMYGLYEVSQGARVYNASNDLSTDEWNAIVDDATYLTYMYYIPGTPGRVTIHLEEVGGRWVLTTVDPYLVWNSGRWLTAFVPVLVLYWFGLAAITGATWLYRASMVLNEELFGTTVQGSPG